MVIRVHQFSPTYISTITKNTQRIIMKQKIKFLLATIMMLVGMTAQAAATVTWNDSDISSGSGTSFSKDGVTMTVTGDCNFPEKIFKEETYGLR